MDIHKDDDRGLQDEISVPVPSYRKGTPGNYFPQNEPTVLRSTRGQSLRRFLNDEEMKETTCIGPGGVRSVHAKVRDCNKDHHDTDLRPDPYPSGVPVNLEITPRCAHYPHYRSSPEEGTQRPIYFNPSQQTAYHYSATPSTDEASTPLPVAGSAHTPPFGDSFPSHAYAYNYQNPTTCMYGPYYGYSPDGHHSWRPGADTTGSSDPCPGYAYNKSTQYPSEPHRYYSEPGYRAAYYEHASNNNRNWGRGKENPDSHVEIKRPKNPRTPKRSAIQDNEEGSQSVETAELEATELTRIQTYVRPAAPVNQNTIARQQTKNAANRRRASIHRENIKRIEAKPSSERSEHEQTALKRHHRKLQRKNDRGRERNLERKQEVARILSKDASKRTKLEVSFLETTLSKRARKNEGDRLRRARLKSLKLGSNAHANLSNHQDMQFARAGSSNPSLKGMRGASVLDHSSQSSNPISSNVSHINHFIMCPDSASQRANHSSQYKYADLENKVTDFK